MDQIPKPGSAHHRQNHEKEDPNAPTISLLRHMLEIFGNRSLNQLPSTKMVTSTQEVKIDDDDQDQNQKTNDDRFTTFAQRLNRNQLQQLISVGAVKVDGEVFSDPSFQINKDDTKKLEIEIDQRAILDFRSKIRIWILNKPEGVVTTFAKTTTSNKNDAHHHQNQKKTNVRNDDDDGIAGVCDDEEYDNDDDIAEGDGKGSSSTSKIKSKNNSTNITNNKTLLEFLTDETDLLETVRTEMSLSTRAERRRQKKEDEGKSKIPQSFPLFPVGRLDCQSCGLLLLTNCGSLCERLLHPDFEHEKEYLVKLDRKLRDPIPERFYQLMREGVSWKPNGDRGKEVTSKPCVVTPVILSNEQENHMFKIQLKEGMNRQIRNQTEAAGRQLLRELGKKISSKEEGYHVIFLKRIAIGPLIRFEDFFQDDDDDDGAKITITRNEQDDDNSFREKKEEMKRPVAVEITGELKERFLNWGYSTSAVIDNNNNNKKKGDDEAVGEIRQRDD